MPFDRRYGMESVILARKRSRLWAALFVVLGILTMGAATALQALANHPDVAGPPSGKGVQPTLHDGNSTCQSFNSSYTEVKFDNWTGNETGGSGITIANATKTSFDWSTDPTNPIAAVFVKGGNSGDLYSYGAAGATSDTKLHAPYSVNHANGSQSPREISHVSFCKGPAALGSISVTKQTDPSNSQAFSFTLSPGDTRSVAGNGGNYTWAGLSAGSYDLTEALSAAQVADGWSLSSASCPGATTTPITNGVKITLGVGQHVACTFTNTQTTTTTTTTSTTKVLGEKIEGQAEVLPITGPEETTMILLIAAGLAFFLGGAMLAIANRREAVRR
jgi:hypothetical protein